MSRISVDIDTSVMIDVSEILDNVCDDDLEKELVRRGFGVDATSSVIRFIDTGRTEEVKEVFDYIRGSYHYDVFKGELDENN